MKLKKNEVKEVKFMMKSEDNYFLSLSSQQKENMLETIKKDVRRSVSEARYEHSIGTMQKAKELAELYGEDPLEAMLVGLVHDIAKEMTKEQYFLYCVQNKIEMDEFDKVQSVTLHGKIGADIAKKKYHFTKEMQDAIYYHTTGRANMTKLDKIIFLADKIEDTRENTEELERVKNLAKRDMDEAILWDIDHFTIPKMIKQRKMIHPDSIFARNDIIRRKTK